jgi:hypothetical protein
MVMTVLECAPGIGKAFELGEESFIMSRQWCMAREGSRWWSRRWWRSANSRALRVHSRDEGVRTALMFAMATQCVVTRRHGQPSRSSRS